MFSHLYAIKDVRSDLFDQSFEAKADQVAVRYIKSLCRQEGHAFQQFPQDFQLYHLGVIDQSTGQIQSDVRHICDLLSIGGEDTNV